MISPVRILAGLLLAGLPLSPSAQSLTFAGCPDVTKADFTKVPLVTRAHNLDEPIQMEVAKDGKIYWVERRGQVRSWNPADNTATTLLNLTSRIYTGTTNQIEHGVSGLALDPGFATNNRLYVFWAQKSPQVFKVSRFTVAGNALTAEKTILEIPYTNLGCCHTAGSMAFDFQGNLFIAVGNGTNNNVGVSNRDPAVATNYVLESDINGDDQARAANTNSLQGKILRIKPKALADNAAGTEWGPGKTYDIPAGNLFPEGTDKTRPEIYTMGHRNPYSITLDPYRNWLTWGEIGPDEWGAGDSVKTEEHNLVTGPGNMGWPYFVGNNQRYRLNKNPAAPANASKNNTGLATLPPAQPAIHPYGHAAAVTGPIYYYDGRLPSKTKLPPHFNKKWLFSDFNSGYIDVAAVADNGKSLSGAVNRFWAQGFLVRPLDVEIGPDGNLYVVDYSGWFGPGTDTRIARVEYRGACQPLDIVPPTVGVEASGPGRARAPQGKLMRLAAGMRMALPAGASRAEVFDLSGRRLLSLRGEGGQTGPALPRDLREGLYYLSYRP